MTDQLFLSVWLDPSRPGNRLRQFEKLLRIFPFSQREQPQSTISIEAINNTEPPLLERPLNGPIDVETAMEAFRDYASEDIAYTVESWWDLWLYDGKDWKLSPARVLLSCFGTEFDNGTEDDIPDQEDIRIDFGVDSRFLPDAELPASGKLIESNVKSLLRLVHEVDTILPISERLLQTESGENFAERLESVLRRAAQIQ